MNQYFSPIFPLALLCALWMAISSFVEANAVEDNARMEIDFNKRWKFLEADKPDFKNKDFNDKPWTVLDVPHDYIFESGVSKDGSQGQSGGYHGGGIAWYRKHFSYDSAWAGKKLWLVFDGVYMNSEVWINGHFLGKRPYGYIGFQYDITPYLHKKNNVLSVRVDNELQPSARWYHPGGIYAPVKLVAVHPTHIATNSLFLHTVKQGKNAKVHVAFNLSEKPKDKSVYRIRYEATNTQGKLLASSTVPIIDLATAVGYETSFVLQSPNLWHPDTPNLYRFQIQLLKDAAVIDQQDVAFGVRDIQWKTDTGFWINGENLKIKGVSEHYEGGPVGGAWTKPLLRWKLNLLKAMGVNAVRVGHNPYPPMFYDLCDELGLMVMDEIFDGWAQKAKHDYGRYHFDAWWRRDIEEWVKRNRNHPSIIVYSVGNETHGEIAPRLVEEVKKYDPTRLVTSGSSNTQDMEVAGINGASEGKRFLESTRFDIPFVATEAPHTWQTRGYYRTQTWWRDGPRENTYPLPNLTEQEIFFYEWTDPKNWTNSKQHFNSSYDNATVRISARKNWERARDLPYHSGHFRWTGFDYHGEAWLAHGGWPFIAFMGGALDLAGFKKDLFYLYQSLWTEEPMLHILPSWTHPRMPKGTEIPVWVYSNLEEVELFLNGKSLGKDKPGRLAEDMQTEWLVPWKEGRLKAVGYLNGKAVIEKSISSSASPQKLKHSIESIDGEYPFSPIRIISSESQDRSSNFYPYAHNTVYYHFSDGVKVKALENGSPVDQTNRIRARHRGLFMGKTRAFLELDAKAETPFAIVGSIIGDESLYSSNKVSIDVQHILLEPGDIKPSDLKVVYALDKKARFKKYRGAFSVKDGDTVYAQVKKGDDIFLHMSQRFGKGEGLFWGNAQSTKMWLGKGISLQAELADLVGAKVKRDGRRVHAGGYAFFDGEEGTVSWYHENDGEDGDYMLRIRYAHDNAEAAVPMQFFVNGQKIADLEFETSGHINQKWRHTGAMTNIRNGANHIVLKTVGKARISIDQLSLD